VIVVGVILGLLVLGGVSFVALGQLESIGGGGTAVDDVQVGQCFDGGRLAENRALIVGVTIIDCADEHDGELIARFDWQGGETTRDYPGEERMVEFAEAGCRREFRLYVGLDFDLSRLDLTYTYPVQLSWLAGVRSVECLALAPAGQKLTESVRGSRR
jgi:hypothetical protein